MKKLLAGLTVLLTASFTGCFAVHGFETVPCPCSPTAQPDNDFEPTDSTS